MDVQQKAFDLLSKYPLCDHCLGRQFAALGYSMENNVRGSSLKIVLTMQTNDLLKETSDEGVVDKLRVLATNGFSKTAQETLKHLKQEFDLTSEKCFLCDGVFDKVEELTKKVLAALADYEFSTYLVGIELPVKIEEREDEFKAAFDIGTAESMKHEFGRLFGKAIGARTGKEAEYLIPDIVAVLNPFLDTVKLQVNPLFVGGRYRKLVRTVSQSKWLCSNCRGRGCEKCGGTGKLYSESVEEFTSEPLLGASEGAASFFHASGREDIDARMLGTGRPFIVEISKPKKRFIDLSFIEEAINAGAIGKVEVSGLHFTTKDKVRRLKKGEGAVKEYRLLAEFENDVLDKDLRLIEEKLTGITVKQQTPIRVLHRRADLIRERYIYKVKVKKVSLKMALLEICCQGGLYVKELVSGDKNRTVPSVSSLLGNRAKTLKLDVLNVIIDDDN
ncbi:MAG: tRNA pseudouridine(54/55) synthase Pus10 [Nitrososphaerota archaeon]|jgi:tRNA pseudouridine synthase 10|nr:tRNA pseudouridine(54/55) synthase Pus10 [Nitrososphaerota archaeon]